ncbi:hypothetical protein HPB50_014875 [Hyalomma asiaticum]|uniref:Uncharacterized protein n=1 Tax=Hyalomma asiaticum TaxID=266040 RepID=A0ACB7SFE1_HYAAI|nr:hypothetical protein HPB50_014875 [Hyalomma asiaticum]
MSSSSRAPQLTQVAANYMPRLLPEVWAEVFRRLDIESLQRGPGSARVGVLCVYRHSREESDFRSGNRRAHHHEVRGDDTRRTGPARPHAERADLFTCPKLRFTNCIALTSEAILGCAQHCCKLRELCCINCIVEPAELFILLSRTLKCVRKL